MFCCWNTTSAKFLILNSVNYFINCRWKKGSQCTLWMCIINQIISNCFLLFFLFPLLFWMFAIEMTGGADVVVLFCVDSFHHEYDAHLRSTYRTIHVNNKQQTCADRLTKQVKKHEKHTHTHTISTLLLFFSVTVFVVYISFLLLVYLRFFWYKIVTICFWVQKIHSYFLYCFFHINGHPYENNIWCNEPAKLKYSQFEFALIHRTSLSSFRDGKFVLLFLTILLDFYCKRKLNPPIRCFVFVSFRFVKTYKFNRYIIFGWRWFIWWSYQISVLFPNDWRKSTVWTSLCSAI